MTRNAPTTPPPKPKKPRTRAAVVALLGCVLLGVFGGVALLRFAPPRLSRPDGMHPVAFGAFVRACHTARVQPFRLAQTLGDDPRSFGYHRRDGTFRENGARREYSAAVDIGVWDLTEPQIARLCSALAQQGFAPFYRRGGKWRGNEHVHAVYALLPMKAQLRRQVREFFAKRRATNLPPLRWEKKLRRRGLARLKSEKASARTRSRFFAHD